MTERLRRFYSQIERGLDDRYLRVGVRYVYELLLVDVAWAASVFVLAAAGLTFYLNGSTSDFLVLLAVSQGALLSFGPIGFAVWARQAPAAMAWLSGERTAELAPAAWEQTVAAPVRAPLTAVVISLPAQVAVGVAGATLYDTGFIGVPVIFAATMIVTVAGVGSVAVFCGQVAARPILREIGSHLPPDFEFTPSRFGLGGHLIGRLTLLGLTMTAVGGGVALITDDPVGRLALGITLAPALLFMLGALAFPAAASSLLGPVNDLIAATRRVAAGDLEAEVPVVSSDELGELSRSFNAMTADLRRMTDDLRDASARIVASSDAARRKVERDLHDGAQQHFVLVDLKLGLLERKLGQDPEAAAGLIKELRADIGRGLAELRELAHGIYPAVLENEGLDGALRDAATRSAMPVQVECDGAGRYEPEIEAAVYFCCLEALQNAAKHAGADARATVRLAAGDSALLFEVADDGAGFEAPADGGSAGLQNMADRIGALGGRLTVSSAPGAGTTVSGRVPV